MLAVHRVSARARWRSSREPGDRREQPVTRRWNRLGADPGEPAGRVFGQGSTRQEQVAQGVGEAGAAALRGTATGEVPSNEEGVCRRSVRDRVDLEAVRAPRRGCSAILGGDLVEVSGSVRGGGPCAAGSSFGEQGAQRWRRWMSRSGDQVAGWRALRPVQVLQDEEDGVRGDALQQTGGGEFRQEAGHAPPRQWPAARRAGDGLPSSGSRRASSSSCPAAAAASSGEAAGAGAPRGGEGAKGHARRLRSRRSRPADDGAPAGEPRGEPPRPEAGLARRRLSRPAAVPCGSSASARPSASFNGGPSSPRGRRTRDSGIWSPRTRAIARGLDGRRGISASGARNDGGREGWRASLRCFRPVRPVTRTRAVRCRRGRSVSGLSASARRGRAARRAGSGGPGRLTGQPGLFRVADEVDVDGPVESVLEPSGAPRRGRGAGRGDVRVLSGRPVAGRMPPRRVAAPRRRLDRGLRAPGGAPETRGRASTRRDDQATRATRCRPHTRGGACQALRSPSRSAPPESARRTVSLARSRRISDSRARATVADPAAGQETMPVRRRRRRPRPGRRRWGRFPAVWSSAASSARVPSSPRHRPAGSAPAWSAARGNSTRSSGPLLLVGLHAGPRPLSSFPCLGTYGRCSRGPFKICPPVGIKRRTPRVLACRAPTRCDSHTSMSCAGAR
ncbi:hypothetical protein FQR65_LT20170 [Abscondita terminalis]|nr:hypothetical protein FQR65_LT20170 [Abscondita terminalis]